MAWKEFNNNPVGRRVGDCAVRAISKALDTDWESAYILLVSNGFSMGDMPSADSVWGATLRQHGFYRETLPDSCPDCYTIKDFLEEHKRGKFILATGTHVVCAVDGNYYDSWDSGDEVPIYYWRKEVKNGV